MIVFEKTGHSLRFKVLGKFSTFVVRILKKIQINNIKKSMQAT